MASAYAICGEKEQRKRYSGECNTEQARARAIIFYKKGNAFPNGTAQENADFFADLELAGNAWIIRETSGEYDGGAAKTAAGFGDIAERIVGRAHVLKYNDGEYIGNEDFYNKISKNARDYNFAWITGSRVWVVEGKTIMIDPTSPQADDVDANIIATVSVKWNKTELPVSYPIDRETLREEPRLAFTSLTKSGSGTETVTGSTITVAAAGSVSSTILFTGATSYALPEGEVLPAGLTLNATTGKISGTLTAPAGTYRTYIVGVNDWGIEGEKQITIVIS